MMKRSVLAILAGAGVYALSTAVAVAGGGLSEVDVPLTIQDVAGVERKGDVCSTGVPRFGFVSGSIAQTSRMYVAFWQHDVACGHHPLTSATT